MLFTYQVFFKFIRRNSCVQFFQLKWLMEYKITYIIMTSQVLELTVNSLENSILIDQKMSGNNVSLYLFVYTN